MEKIVTPFWRLFFSGKREKINQQFKKIKLQYPNLEDESVYALIKSTLVPCLDSFCSLPSNRFEELFNLVFETSLVLNAKNYLGRSAKTDILEKGWKKLIPGLQRLFLTDPPLFLSSVTNALIQFTRHPGSNPEQWIDLLLLRCREMTHLSVFFEFGKVAAWRSGLSHYRKSALQVLRNMDPLLAAQVLGPEYVKPGIPFEQWIQIIMEEPWFIPSVNNDKETSFVVSKVARLGGHHEFGGCFSYPPRVIAKDDYFIGFDEEFSWMIFADLFGSTFIPCPFTKEIQKKNEKYAIDYQVSKQGKIILDGFTNSFPELWDATSIAFNGKTLALTVPHSHYIFFFTLLPDVKIKGGLG